ncbi:MAG: flippase-like domain-containing protein [Melioribacteraceae bacterium]|nr:flippase-like domain-containing protein [Melioribacteraceae bacterium]
MIFDEGYKQKIKKIAGYTLPFILTVVLLYIAFYNVELSESLAAIADISFIWLFIFLIVFLLSHYLRALRWKVILNSVNPDTSTLNLFASVMVGYGVNCVVPRLGEFYRALFGGKWENISRSSMLGTIIIERVIDLIILGISVLVSIAIYDGNLLVDILWLKSALIIGFLVLGIIIVIMYLLIKMKEKFVNITVGLIAKFSQKLSVKLSYVLHMLIEGFSSLKGKKNYLVTIVHSILIMLIYGFTSYIAFFMLRMNEIADVNFSMAWVVMTISAFGIIIPTPGGTGSYHLIVKTVLVSLYGFSEEIGIAYALVTHAISVIVFVSSSFGLIFLANFIRVKKGLSKETFISVIRAGGESQ